MVFLGSDNLVAGKQTMYVPQFVIWILASQYKLAGSKVTVKVFYIFTWVRQ